MESNWGGNSEEKCTSPHIPKERREMGNNGISTSTLISKLPEVFVAEGEIFQETAAT